MSKCLECDLEEDEHHEFVAANPPGGCQCDARTWGNPRNIPAVCAEYKPTGSSGDSYCKTCEHDRACHASTETETVATVADSVETRIREAAHAPLVDMGLCYEGATLERRGHAKHCDDIVTNVRALIASERDVATVALAAYRAARAGGDGESASCICDTEKRYPCPRCLCGGIDP